MSGRWTANDHGLYYTSPSLELIIDLFRSSDDLFWVSWKIGPDWKNMGFLTFNEAFLHGVQAVTEFSRD
jgi:hypothetical protein